MAQQRILFRAIVGCDYIINIQYIIVPSGRLRHVVLCKEQRVSTLKAVRYCSFHITTFGSFCSYSILWPLYTEYCMYSSFRSGSYSVLVRLLSRMNFRSDSRFGFRIRAKLNRKVCKSGRRCVGWMCAACRDKGEDWEGTTASTSNNQCRRCPLSKSINIKEAVFIKHRL